MRIKEKLTAEIKKRAMEEGFFLFGASRAEFMTEEAKHLEVWLNNNQQGQMSYMNNYFDKRVDPTKLVPGAKSVISLALNYFPKSEQAVNDAPRIARYAYGKDYHFILKEKLGNILNFIVEEVGDINARIFVDSAPVLERDWAKRSGLGWIGKNTLLLNKNAGSYFFLAEIILDVELEYDAPTTEHCGTCTKCIDACPTDAIAENGFILDATKCISYLTIELKEEIPNEFKGKMDDRIFGCDICQEVCPWNRFSQPTAEPLLQPHPDLLEMDRRDWQEITKEVFNRIFKKSAVKRTKFLGLKRNIDFLHSK